MRLRDYLKDKIGMFLTHIFSMILLSIYLDAIGNGIGEIILIIVAWASIWAIVFLISFYKRKKYLSNLLETCRKLEEKYLIVEVMDKPQQFDDIVYTQLLKSASKSMMEQMTRIRHERKEYKEYIEQWVHEIKTPIAAMRLICENNKTEATRKLLGELHKTEGFVEQALFYARSETVQKDYRIKEVILSHIVKNAITINKQLLISKGIRVVIHAEDRVFTDSKWIEFMLNQLIVNAAKYGAKDLEITSTSLGSGVFLHVWDNGMGIEESDLPQVFHKGFVGSNGRTVDQSTGIGLYLCKRLCEKLGLAISLESKSNEYTQVQIFFPKGSFVKLQE